MAKKKVQIVKDEHGYTKIHLGCLKCAYFSICPCKIKKENRDGEESSTN